MQNRFSLTVVLCLLLLGGWQLARAWQDVPAVTPPQETGSPDETPENAAGASTPENTLTGEAARSRAKEVLEAARNLLFTSPSIRAKLTQSVSLGDYRFRSEGEYRSADGFRYRLSYRMKLAQLEGEFLEVSDGQMLHTVRTIRPVESKGIEDEELEVSRRDLQRIKREGSKFLSNAKAIQSTEIALGGLPAILASLERSMQFDKVVEETLGGEPVVTLHGTWNPERKDFLMQGLGPMSQQLAPFFPELVRIAFTRDSSFPVRIQYLKLVDQQQLTYLPLLTLSFSEVQFNQPVEFRDFAYIPPQTVEVLDLTSQYLELIRSTAQGVSVDPGASAPQ